MLWRPLLVLGLLVWDLLSVVLAWRVLLVLPWGVRLVVPLLLGLLVLVRPPGLVSSLGLVCVVSLVCLRVVVLWIGWLLVGCSLDVESWLLDLLLLLSFESRCGG